MTNCTDGQIEYVICKLRDLTPSPNDMYEAAAIIEHLADRQAAKAGVVSEEVLEKVFKTFVMSSEHSDKEAMRAALASVWPIAGGDTSRASRHCQCEACMVTHASDCAVHSEPAMPKGPCNCGALPALREIDWEDQRDDIAWSNGWNAYARAITKYPQALKAAIAAAEGEKS